MKLASIPRLLRVENCVMAGLAVVVGFIVAGGIGDLAAINGLLLAFVSAFVITGAGNAINDYYDKGTDRKNAPHRPIPSGAISASGAFYLAVVLFIAGIIMAFFINYSCLALAALNSALLFLYARNLKSSVLAGNLLVSYLTASTFVYGALVLQNPAATVFLALLAFLANVGREMIGDVEDVVGDRKAGMKTFVIVYGEKKAWLYGRSYIFAAVFMSPVPFLNGLMGTPYLFVVAVADAIFVWSAVTRSARRNQQLTKVAILAGLLAFLAGALV